MGVYLKPAYPNPWTFAGAARWTLHVLGVFAFTAAAIPSARAQTLTTIYSFKGAPDGAGPWGGVIRDAAGNIYGTTQAGGNSEDEGTIFKIDSGGNETVLHAFAGWPNDGESAYSGLAPDRAGNRYGTTFEGGSGCYSYGCGAVYKIDAAGEESVLYSFSGGIDGAFPRANVILDSQDNIYGTTANGGTGCPFLGCGVVFKLTPSGQETVLYSFHGLDGAFPYSPVIRDSAGNIYGTTSIGGAAGYGVVFMLDASGNETILHSFTGGEDGGDPLGGLIRDSGENLYGTTSAGGDIKCNAPDGCGVIFKMDASGNETVLHAFHGIPDGTSPGYGSLITDGEANLYGTTTEGGSAKCNAPYGCGIVFVVNESGKMAILHSFTGLTDGGVPYNGLVRDSAGNLYGTTYQGGDFTCNSVIGYGCGVVFKLSPR